MGTERSVLRLTLRAFTCAALAASFALAAPAPDADGEDETKDLDELVARLRNPFFAKQADRDLQIVQLLLRQKTPKADGCLRDLLADTGAHPTVVEQIAIATFLDAEHRLLPEVVERMRRESGSELDRSLDAALLNYSDAAFVQQLVVLARDPARPMEFRAEAVELLGRTGSPEALDPLLDFWGGPQKELREPAARAFERVLPSGAVTREEASVLRDGIRGVPFSEALRRLLRRDGAGRISNPAMRDAEPDYVRLAAQMLPRATLTQVIDSYLGSSVPAVRAMGAKRIAAYPFDAAEVPDGKIRAARECLAALRREDVEAVVLELIAALTARAPELRGAVGESDLSALTDLVRLDGRASNAARLAAVRLVGELRDARAVPVLKDTFASLKDGDVELRLALLEALQQAPGDFTPWLIERLSVETHTRLVRKLVVLLNRAEDPAAISAFARLLATHPDQQVRWDVAKALGTLWAGRQLDAARDALMTVGLADADGTVRRTSASSLGSAGPGRDAVIERLQRVLDTDVDAKVRQAAAKSIVDLDDASAAKNLLPYVADDLEIWRLFRDHLVEDVRRRDKTPDRVLAAADVLAEHGLRRLAIDLLTQVAAEHDGLWESDGGRPALLERLAVLLLEQGDPDGAKAVAQELVETVPREAVAARQKADLLLAMAFCRSGRQEELRDARRSLESLCISPDLAAAHRAEAAVELGDCLLRLGDPVAAASVLDPVVARADLPPALAKKAAMLLEDAKNRAAEEEKKVLAWVDALDGASSADASRGLHEFGVRAAPYLIGALDEAKDASRIRRLVRAAAAVAGPAVPALGESAGAADTAKASEQARAALRALIERSTEDSGGVR